MSTDNTELRDKIEEIVVGLWWAASDYYHSSDFVPRSEKKLLTYQKNAAHAETTKILSLIEAHSQVIANEAEKRGRILELESWVGVNDFGELFDRIKALKGDSND